MAPLRGVWVCAAYAVCMLVTAMFGLALGLAIGEGYSWVAGSPCLPDQFCAVVPIRLGVGLRLGALLGAGLGLLQAFGLLAGDLLFHTLRARSARRHAPAPATPGPL